LPGLTGQSSLIVNFFLNHPIDHPVDYPIDHPVKPDDDFRGKIISVIQLTKLKRSGVGAKNFLPLRR
jgi:hypothetical protein